MYEWWFVELRNFGGFDSPYIPQGSAHRCEWDETVVAENGEVPSDHNTSAVSQRVEV